MLRGSLSEDDQSRVNQSNQQYHNEYNHSQEEYETNDLFEDKVEPQDQEVNIQQCMKFKWAFQPPFGDSDDDEDEHERNFQIQGIETLEMMILKSNIFSTLVIKSSLIMRIMRMKRLSTENSIRTKTLQMKAQEFLIFLGLKKGLSSLVTVMKMKDI